MSKIIEEWQPILDNFFEEYYEVSNTGKVRSLPRLITPKNNTKPYTTNYKELTPRTNGVDKHLFVDLTVTICDKKYRKSLYIHKAVAECFVLNENPKKFDKVTHINGDRSNNNYTNLKWTNQSEISSLIMNKPENRNKLKKK